MGRLSLLLHSMRVVGIVLLSLLIDVTAVRARGQTLAEPGTVVVPSGNLQLRALLFRPKGNGPFPAVLFNHGRGAKPQTEGRVEGITELGHLFARHGYVFLALFRRGEGLSADQGMFIGDALDRERGERGDEAAKKLQVRLLESDQLGDALAGLAFLRALPEVDGQRVAVIGHSFGGSLALVVAERDKTIRGVVNFAGAAASWKDLPELRERLIRAVGQLSAPVLFV